MISHRPTFGKPHIVGALISSKGKFCSFEGIYRNDVAVPNYKAKYKIFGLFPSCFNRYNLSKSNWTSQQKNTMPEFKLDISNLQCRCMALSLQAMLFSRSQHQQCCCPLSQAGYSSDCNASEQYR